MMKHYVCVVVLLALSACATVFDGSNQNINVEAINIANNKPVKDAKCTITDEMGRIYMVSDNPGHVKVRKGQGVLRFDCKKPGFEQKNTVANETFNSTAFFNVFTLGAGFFVDAVTGATLEYPENIIIRMEEER